MSGAQDATPAYVSIYSEKYRPLVHHVVNQ